MVAIRVGLIDDATILLIPDHSNIVIQKAPHQWAQLSGVSPSELP